MSFIANFLSWVLGVALGAGIATHHFDHGDAFKAGYTQGQLDQAAIQKTLRKGICK